MWDTERLFFFSLSLHVNTYPNVQSNQILCKNKVVSRTMLDKLSSLQILMPATLSRRKTQQSNKATFSMARFSMARFSMAIFSMAIFSMAIFSMARFSPEIKDTLTLWRKYADGA